MTGELWRREPGGLRLALRVTPKSSRDEVTGVQRASDGTMSLAVKVRALPDKGAANAAVIGTLAQALGLRKSAISLASGSSGRSKSVMIEGDPNRLEQSIGRVLQGLEGKGN